MRRINAPARMADLTTLARSLGRRRVATYRFASTNRRVNFATATQGHAAQRRLADFERGTADSDAEKNESPPKRALMCGY
jgi:hypothetical protein